MKITVSFGGEICTIYGSARDEVLRVFRVSKDRRCFFNGSFPLEVVVPQILEFPRMGNVAIAHF